MGIYLALLLAVGALVAVLLYFFGSTRAVKPAPARVQGDDARTPEQPASPATGGLIHVVARTDPGLKRKHNEDSYLVVEERALFVVADGMGRHAAGEVASQQAVETIEARFRDETEPAPGADGLPAEGRLLREAILEANRIVFRRSHEEDAYQGMGTTVVALHFSARRDRVAIGSAGDSRCYRLRSGELKQLTTDHTLGAAGIVGSNAAMLSRAVGIEEGLEVDVLMDTPLPDDLYMLCSDGLSRMVSHEGMTETLQEARSLEQRAQKLIELANQAGGRDNVTVILVLVDGRKAA